MCTHAHTDIPEKKKFPGAKGIQCRIPDIKCTVLAIIKPGLDRSDPGVSCKISAFSLEDVEDVSCKQQVSRTSIKGRSENSKTIRGKETYQDLKLRKRKHF